MMDEHRKMRLLWIAEMDSSFTVVKFLDEHQSLRWLNLHGNGSSDLHEMIYGSGKPREFAHVCVWFARIMTKLDVVYKECRVWPKEK